MVVTVREKVTAPGKSATPLGGGRPSVYAAGLETEEARVARTESVFRHVNEKIAETTENSASDESLFVCECADAGCQDRLELPLDEYEEVRGVSTRFVVAEGHEEPRYERVVKRRPGYWIVEKVAGRVAAMVRRSDPRAQTS